MRRSPALRQAVAGKIQPFLPAKCGGQLAERDDRMTDSSQAAAPPAPSIRIEVTVVKLTLRDKETAQEAVRRFRKLVERSGIKKEMRVREFYEKPSETKRRARLRAQRRARRERFMATHP
jgi:small subunit ribosomal protein S21